MHGGSLVHGEAPGRVNLIGEHTDYNGGFVLPMPLPLRTRVTLARRSSRLVTAASTGVAARVQRYTLGEEHPRHDWLDYVQGMTWALREAGCALTGFDLRIASEVPIGSGLSSSAALLVALGKALQVAFDLPLDDVTIAQCAQRSENAFVGARVGLMDPMVCALGRPGAALFLDTRDLSYRHIAISQEHIGLLVIDSGISHRNASGGYNVRRAECEEAAWLLGVKQLRDLTPDDLPQLNALPDVLRRRTRHVISENRRVLAAVTALETWDVHRLGALLDASHTSLRDDYEVSTPEVDRLVDLVRTVPGVYGARMTGGGFGGAVVALCTPGEARQIAERVLPEYALETGRAGRMLVPGPG
ncbi:MAG TPA: galactokinase [Rhodothermales bacterium]|nr:galactokinase [Rhodothermales bacterium]